MLTQNGLSEDLRDMGRPLHFPKHSYLSNRYVMMLASGLLPTPTTAPPRTLVPLSQPPLYSSRSPNSINFVLFSSQLGFDKVCYKTSLTIL